MEVNMYFGIFLYFRSLPKEKYPLFKEENGDEEEEDEDEKED